MRATQRLYLTWDRAKVVPESNPDGRFLFCKPGDEVPDEQARKYGLLQQKAPAPPPAAPPTSPQADPKKAAAEPRRAQMPGEDLDTHTNDELLEIAEKLQVAVPEGGREALIVAILKKAGYQKEAEGREKKAAAEPENKMAGKPQDKGAHFPPQSRRR